MTMKKSGIYSIKNKITHKIYVGSAIDINDRWRCHIKDLKNNKHHSPYLQKSWNKYGTEMFEFQILEECEKEVLIEREQYWIDYFDSYRNGYNSTPKAGNTLGFKMSEYSKLKMSNIKSKKGKLLNEIFSTIKTESFYQKTIGEKKDKTIDKLNPFYGKKHKEESIKKMSEKALDNYRTGKRKKLTGKDNPLYGKQLTNSHKNKISIANSGKNNPNSKKVFQYDLEMNLVKEWDSVGIVCKILNLSVGNISSCCLGKRKTAYGFIWKYN